ncbi:MAG: calcium/sodium antiporter [Deltaproteobacteria bacterium]|nr:calcium/sodium antiporter [Deltaproteobacteria bacterium]MBN2674817.1 calcium/sodium antiporter [Deltaproteobacteria bacterium]
MWIDLLLLIGGGAFVWLGAEGIVTGAVKLAAYYGVSAMVVGLTVVAFGTSAPELVVSSVAAFQGHNEIALGNVLGSNIINIALVLGLSAVIAPMVVTRETFRQDLPLVAVITVLVVAMAIWGDDLNRFEGIVLLCVFAGYTVYTFIRAFNENRRTTRLDTWERPELKAKHIMYLVGGIPVLALGAEGMVRGAVGIAETIGISKQIIAMTMVAFGTSVPELAASVVAARHGEGDLCVGNVLGSNLYNMSLILGTAAAISPIPTIVTWMSMDIIFFVAAVLVLFPLMRIGWRVGRIDGIILLFLYVTSVLSLFI